MEVVMVMIVVVVVEVMVMVEETIMAASVLKIAMPFTF